MALSKLAQDVEKGGNPLYYIFVTDTQWWFISKWIGESFELKISIAYRIFVVSFIRPIFVHSYYVGKFFGLELTWGFMLLALCQYGMCKFA